MTRRLAKNTGGGVVSAATPEAAADGVAVLREGGNAVDAAVAVSLVLAVTEPAGSGLGGQGTLIVRPARGETLVINGTSFSPAVTPADASLADLAGHRATTVPSLLRVLDFAWRQHGSGRLPWSRLVEPAVRRAREGYPLGPFRRRSLLRHARALRQSPSARRFLLSPDGSVPEEGSLQTNPTLASTLERIAREGAEDFYHGDLARRIARDVAAHGGWLTREDLELVPEPPVLAPLRGTYRGLTVDTLPPPASGWVVLVALNLLERFPVADLEVEGAARTIALAEILRFAHRERLLRPVRDLLRYHKQVESKLDKDRAGRLVGQLEERGGETTHFSLVDGGGTAVGVTQSLNGYYGARVAAPELGFLYNDYMREFVGTAGHPYDLEPRSMPYSSMSATIVSRDGRPCLVLGSPANERIISAVVQVLGHWVDVGAGIESAVAAPRLHAEARNDVLLERDPEDLGVALELERRGFSVLRPLSSLFAGDFNPYFGGVHAVAAEGGGWRGAADPRRDGAVESC